MIEVPAEQSNHPIFVGGQVTTQPLVADDMGAHFNISIVNFSPGARNKFHSHSSDQVLLVTAGSGIVATDGGETAVNVGDMIHIPAGEKHWHGATKESAFSHISITQLGSTGQQLE
ncbi:cupin domain-containing protein [SAR202 cluster bacterium AC-647-N09_OGT_505m]|nr:cupin domain-containing protein [SAR202 cluster bacterium AC-647-N09_OGT_505m]